MDQAGKTLRATTINNSGIINISGMSAGIYYLKNNNTGEVQKVLIG